VAPAPTTAGGSAAAPSTAAGGGATVNAQSVGSAGTILVDGATGMTLYNFTKDTKDSGKSACTGGCISTWPALTVAGGGTPAAGAGVTGTLATITRDDGTVQVTYNGLPLYFFKNDKAPGDLNGVYDSWVTVKP
jgi:predicted lipoprotein with Yx(FWY)xxD motif